LDIVLGVLREGTLELQTIFAPIAKDLPEVETRLRAASHAEFGPLAEVIESVIFSGGKRIRPALVLLCGRMHPVEDEPLLRLATAVEMLHLATLIHDDLLDKSPVRRGAPTISSRWNEKATVLAGDYVLARAAQISAEVENFQVMSIFAQAVMVICEGEIRQDFNGHHATTDRQDYYDRIFAKTASLFSACAEAAAVLNSAPEAERAALREYGRNLGMAFQIADDVLDFVGTQREVGKPVGSDLRQGLVTLPTIYFYEMDARRDRLAPLLAPHGQLAAEPEPVIEWIRGSPAIAASQAEAARYADLAQRALETLPLSDYRQALHDLAAFVVERKN
jgi:geranylgeranyl pyrophosphate synthase